MKKPHPIIVALDGMSVRGALRIARMLSGSVWGFKVNDLLFEDPAIVRKLKKYGKVFADAKLHDIPNTVQNSVRRLSKAGADIITIHGSGGMEMMRAARAHAGKSKIVAVTILTSHKRSSEAQMKKYVRQVLRVGIDGVVCSAHELSVLRRMRLPSSFIKIVPAIRPKWYVANDDQCRTIEPREALDRGASFLVIGRPITTAPDCREITKRILATLHA